MRFAILFAFGLCTVSAALAQLTWSPCTMPLNTLTDLAMGPNGELVTFLTTNPIQPMLSTDQGETWQTHPGAGGPNGIALMNTSLHVSITGTILLWGTTGAVGDVWRSNDGGNTFTQVGSTNGIPASGFFMGFASSPWGDLYLYGDGVLRSTDDGQTWSNIVPETTFIDVLTASTTSIFGMQLGVLYQGGADGAGFAAINTGGTDVTNGQGLARGLDQRIVAVGGADRVITSTDDGSTWQTANAGLSSTPAEFQHVATSVVAERWVIGKQISVRYTDDAGATWQTAETGLGLAQNEPIQAIFCDSTGTFYLYGYFHLYRSNISTGIDVSPLEKEEGIMFPNPTDGALRLPSSFTGQTCQVIDAAGREVMRSAVGYDGILDLSVLEEGRYALRSADGARVVSVHIIH